jgi:sortase A
MRETARRTTARIASLVMVLGLVAVLYGIASVAWRDPVTDLYANWQQERLAGELDKTLRTFERGEAARFLELRRSSASLAAEQGRREALVSGAGRFERTVRLGQPLGRIVIPRLGLSAVFVHGTRWTKDLSRGPGHYPETGLPAVARVVAIAGHRTTFGAPFRHIDDLRPGHEAVLRLPYGTFHYRVVGHEIVKRNDWSILRDRPYDTLVLTACHPLGSASHRWVVYARLSWVETEGGRTSLWSPPKSS